MAELGGAPPKPPGGGPKGVFLPATPRVSAPRRANAPARLDADRSRFESGSGGGAAHSFGEVPDLRSLVGDESASSEQLGSMSAHLVAEHVMRLLASRRASSGRDALVAEIGELLVSLGDQEKTRKIVRSMADAGRIVDIYPLEVAAYILTRAAETVPWLVARSFVKNCAELESRVFIVEEEIRLRIPVAARMKMFALEGGGSPGYCFAPGAPDEYVLEFGAPGRFTLLMAADLHGECLLDRVRVEVVES